jgi:uncharacterized DUF497 family protein
MITKGATLVDQIFDWSEDKNDSLKRERGISFEKITTIIRGEILDIITNPSTNHPQQKCFIIEVDGYAWVVPYVAEGKRCFLKTAFPSRKYQKIYLNKESDDENL